MSRISFRRAGFTLVELLVVVAVIALLVSILLPALGQAKEEAKMAVCLMNIKALGVAFGYYTTENKQWFPAGSGWGGDQPIWDATIRDFYENPEILHCPSDPIGGDRGCHMNRRQLWEHYGTPKEDQWPRSYGFNTQWLSNMGPSEYGEKHKYITESGRDCKPPFPWPGDVGKMTDVEKPAETLLLGEVWAWGYTTPTPIHCSCRAHITST